MTAAEALTLCEQITDAQMQNSISYKDIDDVDADSFLSYLYWKSSADDSGSTEDTQMMSAQDFYNNF